MPVIFFYRTQESTEYTVLAHIGVWLNQNKYVVCLFVCLTVFISSFMECSKNQEVDLSQVFSAKHLDSSPEIQVC